MKSHFVFRITLFVWIFTLCFAVCGAEDNPMLAKFALRLDAVEKKFWRIAPLPEDHRSRPKFTAELYELENMARNIRLHCVGYKEPKVPDLYNDVIMLTRTFDQFRVNSKFKVRSFTIAATGMKEYQKRHSKLMRERDIEEESETGKKSSKNSAKYKVRPQMLQVDIDDYSEFLDEVADKNSRKFSSWADGLKSREKSKTAEQIFSVWQKSICDMRVKLALLAKHGKFKEEKKNNVGSNNRR